VFKNEVWRTQIIVIGLGILILVGLFWVNFQFASTNPGGNDFLVHYIGTRSLLLDGVSPYSDEVALEIQQQVFGRPAISGEIEHRVVYPIYSVILFAPFALINNYTISRVAWMLFLELCLVVSAFFTLRILKWRLRIVVLGAYFLFSVLWYHGFRGVINGNAIIPVSLFFIMSLYAIKIEQYGAAGCLLAISTIKPNVVLLGIIAVLFWCYFQEKRMVIVWFFGSILILVLGGMILVPNWIVQNIWEILRYPSYNPPGSIADVLSLWIPRQDIVIHWSIGVSLGILYLYELWNSRTFDFQRFLWTISAVLVISQWIGIATDPGNFVILFLPFSLVLARLSERWESRKDKLLLVIFAVVFLGLWIIFLLTLSQTYQPMQNPIMFIPFPAIVLVGLYWIRWWTIRTRSLVNSGNL